MCVYVCNMNYKLKFIIFVSIWCVGVFVYVCACYVNEQYYNFYSYFLLLLLRDLCSFILFPILIDVLRAHVFFLLLLSIQFNGDALYD